MSPFVRKKPNGGGTAVQIMEKVGRANRVIEHIGTAHSPAELAAMVQLAEAKLHPDQGVLDVLDTAVQAPGVIRSKRSRWLWEALTWAYMDLGFECVGDRAFMEMVLARIIRPASKAETVGVLEEIGITSSCLRTMFNALGRAQASDYRAKIAKKCFEHCESGGDVSLVLYDVTTLYFEAEREDDLRKVGYSKERRVDPQVVVGLLVDRNGFPLEIGCFEGDKAETHTMVPIVKAFQDRHALSDMVVVADAGMMSAVNLRDLDEAGLRFIVGARQVKAPGDLANHFHWSGTAFTDGQVIDTITPRHRGQKQVARDTRAEPVWDPALHEKSWRAIWVYSHKRAVRDTQTLALQETKARGIIDGIRTSKQVRFVKTTKTGRSVDESALKRAKSLVGLKGYLTNIPTTIMPAGEVVASYHDLWHVEQSFRMSKTDLAARPMFHHNRDAIEAHLTIVFTALAVARHLQVLTGMSIKKIVQTLRPLQEISIRIGPHDYTAADPLPPPARQLLTSLGLDPIT